MSVVCPQRCVSPKPTPCTLSLTVGPTLPWGPASPGRPVRPCGEGRNWGDVGDGPQGGGTLSTPSRGLLDPRSVVADPKFAFTHPKEHLNPKRHFC